MPWITALVVSLLAQLFTAIVPLVIRTLAGLGVGYVVYTGASAVMDTAKDYVMDQYTGIPSAALSLADMSGGTIAINIIFAAYAANIGIKAAMGVFEKFSTKSTWRS